MAGRRNSIRVYATQSFLDGIQNVWTPKQFAMQAGWPRSRGALMGQKFQASLSRAQINPSIRFGAAPPGCGDYPFREPTSLASILRIEGNERSNGYEQKGNTFGRYGPDHRHYGDSCP